MSMCLAAGDPPDVLLDGRGDVDHVGGLGPTASFSM
jgi:hypothetical protein